MLRGAQSWTQYARRLVGVSRIKKAPKPFKNNGLGHFEGGLFLGSHVDHPDASMEKAMLFYMFFNESRCHAAWRSFCNF